MLSFEPYIQIEHKRHIIGPRQSNKRFAAPPRPRRWLGGVNMTDYPSARAAPAGPRRLPRAALLAWGLCALICAGSLVNLAVALANPAAYPGNLRIARAIAWNLLPVVFAVPAALIVARQPRNRIGWILMVPPAAFMIGNPIDNYISILTVAPPPSVPIFLMLWFQSWSWLLLILPLPLMMLLFPTGRSLTPRWRWVQTAAAALLAYAILLSAAPVVMTPANAGWSLPNPIGFVPVDEPTFQLVLLPWLGGLGLLILISAVALFVRYRRASVTERLQIKWLLFAAALFVLFYISDARLAGGDGVDG